MMRVSIREQLGLLVLFCSLMSLMVLALAVWFQNYNFITSIRLSGLSLTASLKAAQITSSLLLYNSQARLISTRLLIQSALGRYNAGNDSADNWARSLNDFQGALGNGSVLVQAIIYPNSFNGNETAVDGLLNVTALGLVGQVKLPFASDNGSSVFLGDPGMGFPPMLYPNLTYGAPQPGSTVSTINFEGREIDPDDTLFLGPLVVNESYALISVTVPLINNTSNSDILGWMTAVANTNMISAITQSPEGLGNTGEVLVVAPGNDNNHFDKDIRFGDKMYAQTQSVRYVLPPASTANVSYRHRDRSGVGNASTPFLMKQYPAVVSAWTKDNDAVNNAGAYISTHNEEGDKVSVGYATLGTKYLDWVVLVEQSHGEVVGPIVHLRNVVLICVFAVTGLLLLIMFPMAHYSITPIRQLAAATARTVEPYQPDDQSEYSSTVGRDGDTESSGSPGEELARKEGFFGSLSRITNNRETEQMDTPRRRRRTFRIPRKVPERKHFVTDELTELTRTFNEMSDELGMQYERLEERVKERTAELEKSKKAAEAANQSKTLFIANISHELKTPLNGILGLTTVCMNEDDPSRIRSTLNTIYKSGDLLLHLLTDLLTFSKNEVGQQLAIDEAEFRLNDLSTQLMPTFEKQAREAQVNLQVHFLGTTDAFGDGSDSAADKLYGPAGTGRVRDMCLWGDKNRILQVLMNFVSNSLKFTPAQGSVTVRVRCTGIVQTFPSRAGSARKSSLNSKKSKSSSNRRVRISDSSLLAPDSADAENSKSHHRSGSTEEARLSITVAGGKTHIPKIAERRRSMSPPPVNTKDLSFDFEVEDTGPGIPPEQQQMIFEPFVQGDLGLSKKYGGTGLGLSICAQLAALMGGEISLDSEVGVGSKFTMRIPLRYVTERSPSMASSTRRTLSKASSLVGQALHDDPPDGPSHNHMSSAGSHTDQNQLADVPRIVGFTAPYVAKETKPSGSPDAKLSQMRKMENEAAEKGRKVRVLVAEDNPVNQEVVLRMLKLEDVYDVTIAKDGQEAFDKVRDSMSNGKRFDLVFMDVQMPNLDGIQSTKLIREMGFTSPIVALTAFAEKSNEDECMASGMDYFLAKPIRRPALKQVLKKYCATIPEEEHEGSSSTVPGLKSRPGKMTRREQIVAKEPKVDVADADDVSPMS